MWMYVCNISAGIGLREEALSQRSSQADSVCHSSFLKSVVDQHQHKPQWPVAGCEVSAMQRWDKGQGLHPDTNQRLVWVAEYKSKVLRPM